MRIINDYGNVVTAIHLYCVNGYKMLALTTPNGSVKGYVVCRDYTMDGCDYGDMRNASGFKNAKFYDVHGLKDATDYLYSKLEEV